MPGLAVLLSKAAKGENEAEEPSEEESSEDGYGATDCARRVREAIASKDDDALADALTELIELHLSESE